MRTTHFLYIFGAFATAAIAAEPVESVSPAGGGLQIEIQSPAPDYAPRDGETRIDVEGIASAIGGVRYIDMVFVMDTSQSLRSTDPEDYRSSGAIGLVRNLSPKSDIQIGVVTFDNRGEIAQELTSDRDRVVQVLRDLPRSGSTNMAAGIHKALEDLEQHGRPGSSRVIMLFTDGKSNEKAAYEAAVRAHAHGASVQSLLLGSSRKGETILDTIAWATGGSFLQVSDPTELPKAFLDLRTTGVDSVMLSVNGSPPVAARLAGGTFSGTVPVEVGDNDIVARATSLDGEVREASVTVSVRDTSCSVLEVAAVKDGRPVISLADKAVEIVVDASRSMWGRMDGEPKMAVAKSTLHDMSYWLPDDLELALRAYGSTSPSDSNNCADSTLLVPFGERNRDSVRRAVADLRPLGQTPIAYALQQAARDFGGRQSDRALIMVTDGIESCGGDPVRAARELGEQGIRVHLIGFGMGSAADEDTASLRAVAAASGGRYVTAGSAAELKDALTRTVATAFSVYRGTTEVATGSLGSGERLLLPAGEYRVELHSTPPQVARIRLEPRDELTLTMERRGNVVTPRERRTSLPHVACDAPLEPVERLTRRN